MPQSLSFLADQRGSALAGVLSLCMVLTLSAAGYLTLVANAQSHGSFVQDDAVTQLSAETGFLIGIRSVTKHDSSELAAMGSGSNHLIMNWTDVDGDTTRVVLTSVTPPDRFRLESWSTRGQHHDTSIIRGEIQITEEAGPDSCVVAIKGWKDTVRTGY